MSCIRLRIRRCIRRNRRRILRLLVFRLRSWGSKWIVTQSIGLDGEEAKRVCKKLDIKALRGPCDAYTAHICKYGISLLFYDKVAWLRDYTDGRIKGLMLAMSRIDCAISTYKQYLQFCVLLPQADTFTLLPPELMPRSRQKKRKR
jgi:hypothetical protein